MDSSVSYNDDEHIESHISKSQRLEAAYQEALRNTDIIVKDEGTRRLRLRILMLENENDDLHEQLALGDDRIDVLEQDREELREQLECAQDETEKLILTRELANLKPELEHLRIQASHQQSILTEKLSLGRELATLKPELEHLRSQASYQQSILSEKLALQRQVSSLEVELETEKRASRRAAEMNNFKEREAEFQNQVEALQKDLAREKREGGKVQREVEKELKASESRHIVLESKLDQMRTKLRATKEQLKECQAELSQARTAPAKPASMLPSADGPARNPRKRAALEMSTDVTIGTPDGVAVRGKRPAVKRGSKDQTMLGEKSMFSITPFLNRTVNMAPNTPTKDPEPDILEDDGQASTDEASFDAQDKVVQHAPVTSEVSPLIAAPKDRINKAAQSSGVVDNKVLGETRTTIQNKKSAPKKRVVTTLEKVTEEDIENEEAPTASTTDGLKKVAASKAMNAKPAKLQTKASEADETGPKKKKRKLLGGKTLFDEEDGETAKRASKASLGAPRLLGKGGLAGPGGGLKGGIGAGFGAFSPLKKDRRGVGASFLA